jgi:hypothetical protein
MFLKIKYFFAGLKATESIFSDSLKEKSHEIDKIASKLN